MLTKSHILNKQDVKTKEMNSEEFEIQRSLEKLKQEIRKYRDRQNEMKFAGDSDDEGRQCS